MSSFGSQKPPDRRKRPMSEQSKAQPSLHGPLHLSNARAISSGHPLPRSSIDELTDLASRSSSNFDTRHLLSSCHGQNESNTSILIEDRHHQEETHIFPSSGNRSSDGFKSDTLGSEEENDHDGYFHQQQYLQARPVERQTAGNARATSKYPHAERQEEHQVNQLPKSSGHSALAQGDQGEEPMIRCQRRCSRKIIRYSVMIASKTVRQIIRRGKLARTNVDVIFSCMMRITAATACLSPDSMNQVNDS